MLHHHVESFAQLRKLTLNRFYRLNLVLVKQGLEDAVVDLPHPPIRAGGQLHPPGAGQAGDQTLLATGRPALENLERGLVNRIEGPERLLARRNRKIRRNLHEVTRPGRPQAGENPLRGQ